MKWLWMLCATLIVLFWIGYELDRYETLKVQCDKTHQALQANYEAGCVNQQITTARMLTYCNGLQADIQEAIPENCAYGSWWGSVWFTQMPLTLWAWFLLNLDGIKVVAAGCVFVGFLLFGALYKFFTWATGPRMQPFSYYPSSPVMPPPPPPQWDMSGTPPPQHLAYLPYQSHHQGQVVRYRQ